MDCRYCRNGKAINDKLNVCSLCLIFIDITKDRTVQEFIKYDKIKETKTKTEIDQIERQKTRVVNFFMNCYNMTREQAIAKTNSLEGDPLDADPFVLAMFQEKGIKKFQTRNEENKVTRERHL